MKSGTRLALHPAVQAVCVEPAQGGVGGGGGVSAEVTLLSLTFVRTTVATSGSWQREVGRTHAEGPA